MKRAFSLKWSFAQYLIVCLVVAGLLCLLTALPCEILRNALGEKYRDYYESDAFLWSYVVDENGNTVGRTRIGITAPDGSAVTLEDYMEPRDRMIYTLLQYYPLLMPLYFAASVAVTSVLFYRRRLKRPLEALDAAAGRIAAGELEFAVEVPGRDELHRLGESFDTMRAALAENSRELWRTLEDSHRMQAAFAHDLRTPLTVLRGYNEFLLKYQGRLSEEKVRGTLETMHASIERLERYTQRMGAAQKLERLPLQKTPTDLEELAAALARDGAILCGQACAFEMKTEGLSGTAALDAALVREVFENLTANAARYAETRVEVECVRKDGCLAVTVRDDGPGFSPSALAHAQEAFWREETVEAARGEDHFGLGLHLCAALCQKHGGALALGPAPGRGAEATATFALTPQAAAHAPAPPAGTAAQPGAGRRKKSREMREQIQE